MKKMIKLSLVAAVAVAGLTTSVSAKPLADAIKDVDLSGSISVGYNHYSDKDNLASTAKVTDNETEYDVYIKATSKVNDTMSFTASIENDYSTVEGENTQNTRTVTTAGGDTFSTVGERSDLYVKEIYFTYANGATTAKAGKQGVGTPWTSSVRGDGVLASYNAGPATLVAAHFNNTTLLTDEDVSVVAALAKVGPVNVEAWALSTTVADGVSVAAKAKVGPATIAARHTTSELESDYIKSLGHLTQDTFKLTKVCVSGDAGPVALKVAYGTTNNAVNGVARGDGNAQGVALNKDNGESADLYMDQARLDDLNDADALVLGASMKMDAYSIGATYLTASSDNYTGTAVAAQKADVDELNIKVGYAMSKNFSITGLYSSMDVEVKTVAGTRVSDDSDDRMELSLNYSF